MYVSAYVRGEIDPIESVEMAKAEILQVEGFETWQMQGDATYSRS
jgi:hypothetical protein